MVGIIPALLVEFIKQREGETAVAQLLSRAGLPNEKHFNLHESYAEEEWQRLFHAAILLSSLDSDGFEKEFARFCGDNLARRFGGFLRGATGARDLIRRQPLIHNFIAASVRDPASRKSIADKFRLAEFADQTVIHYVSPNRLCLFYKGLAQWAADYFQESIHISEPLCLKSGDPECEIHIRFTRPGKAKEGGTGLESEETGLRQDVNEIADQLAAAVSGNFDFHISLETHDPMSQKLCIMIDFLLETTRRALKVIDAKNQDLEQFAYIVSHDLKEPLRMISIYSKLVEERYHGKLDDEATEFVGHAIRGAERMGALIDGLIAISKVGSIGTFQAVECAAAVKTALANLKLVIDEAHACVSVGNLPVVMGDELLLIQLFQNLIGNALKFRNSERPTQVRIYSEREGNEWLFKVEDNGIGIDMRNRDRIFEVFQRLHSGEKYAGTGIGLTISKKIVQQHGGHIWVESTPLVGSTFKFTLPSGS